MEHDDDRKLAIAPEATAFMAAEDEYRLALKQWAAAAAELRDVKWRLSGVRRELDEREAEIQLDPNIDGKNAETRRAQLLLLLRDSQGYSNCQGELDALTNQSQQCQDALSVARDAMSLAKRCQDWCIVYANLLLGKE